MPKPQSSDSDKPFYGIVIEMYFADKVVAQRHAEGRPIPPGTYLAEEFATGDVAVAGSGSYANWSEQLLSWKECEPPLEGFCAEAGLPC